MSSHTPPPWKVLLQKHKTGRTDIGIVEATGTNKWIARITPQPEVSADQELADAHVIATAPELLLACEGALVALTLGKHVDQTQAIEYLKQTIAKAEGKKI